MSTQKIVCGFKALHKYEICTVEQLKPLTLNISNITHLMIRRNPCASSISTEVYKQLMKTYPINENEYCTQHLRKFIDYATQKCILNSLKSVRNIFKKETYSKKNKKTPNFHYKLRILSDK